MCRCWLTQGWQKLTILPIPPGFYWIQLCFIGFSNINVLLVNFWIFTVMVNFDWLNLYIITSNNVFIINSTRFLLELVELD